MIIDSIENASRYFSIHPLFAKAFQYIQQTDLVNAPLEKTDIAEGLKATVSNPHGKTKEMSLEKFECHNKYIDIQFCINGIETIGWKPRKKCVLPKGEFNEEKDVLFYGDTPDTFFQITNGQFAILFPEDVHAPTISDGEIKKLVIKVKI